MYLLDTNIVSELRRPRPDVRVAAWSAQSDPASSFLSVVTCFEIQRGIAILRPRDGSRAAEMSEWLQRVVQAFGARLLGLDEAVARRWGELSAALGNKNLDLAIAATALEHGLTVATRNVDHFVPAGVTVYDPFADRTYAPG